MVDALRLFSCHVLAIVAVLATPSLVWCAEPSSADQFERDQWTKYYAQQLPRYKFYLEGEQESPLQVDPKAALRWANPVRIGRTHGDLFVWTHRGRAALVGTIFSYDTPGETSPSERVVAHGFHSLSTQAIIGERDGAPLPVIEGPGIEFEVIEGAPPPARTRPLRLAQMRQLARDFTAATRENDVVEPLRPLPQPIYRYDAREPESDGAVFAFVSGTDPELIMVIEVRPTADGPRWHFAAGRYANVPLELKLKSRVVWEFSGRASREGGYFSQHGIDVQPLTPAVDDAP